MKVYTKTGDKGSTSLVDNSRVLKSSLRIRVVGELDEVNARLGSFNVVVSEKNIREFIEIVQSRLLDCGAWLAHPDPSSDYIAGINAAFIHKMEQSIDDMSESLEPLTTFILPGGTESSARAHLARSAVRAAEREVIKLKESGVAIDPLILMFLNRLSDWLFVVARYENAIAGQKDVLWHKG